MIIKDWLEMLDLPEDEQKEWLSIHGVTLEEDVNIELSLADLAFRMRDEVIKLKQPWIQARIKVCSKMDWSLYDWNSIAQPIHWIAAARIAEILAEEKNA